METYSAFQALLYINQRVGRERARYLKGGKHGFVPHLLEAGDLEKPITEDQLDKVVSALNGAVNVRDIVDSKHTERDILYGLIDRHIELDPYIVRVAKWRRWINTGSVEEFRATLDRLYSERAAESELRREHGRKSQLADTARRALVRELGKRDIQTQTEALDRDLAHLQEQFRAIGREDVYRRIVGSESDDREDKEQPT